MYVYGVCFFMAVVVTVWGRVGCGNVCCVAGIVKIVFYF